MTKLMKQSDKRGSTSSTKMMRMAATVRAIRVDVNASENSSKEKHLKA